MLLTEIDICKMALSRLRHTTPLPSVDDVADLTGATRAEQELAIWYAPTLLELLELTAWRPATVFESLVLAEASDGTQPWSGQWEYSFVYPDNCAVVRAVIGVNDRRRRVFQREWDVSNDGDQLLIFADIEEANVEYVQSLPDATLYGLKGTFCKALAMRLAWNIAPGLGIADTTRQAVERDYMMAQGGLSRVSINEAESGPETPGTFVVSRGGG